MKKQTPSYYAVIPANVRYSEISSSAKLLFGEITALSTEKGYCWASNSYFAELYKVHNDTITEWVKQLFDNGFIKIEDGGGKNRKISLSVKTPRLPSQPRRKHLANPGENTEQNNTREYISIREQQSAVVELYKTKFNQAYRRVPKLDASHYVVLTKVLKKDGQEFVAAVIDYYFSLDTQKREKVSPSPDLKVLLSGSIINKILPHLPEIENAEQKKSRLANELKLKNCLRCRGEGGFMKNDRWVICNHE